MAQRARVSIATVSYVFNETDSVSEETKARVWAAAEALGYQPNVLGRSLRNQESRIIGYNCYRFPGYLRNPILSELIASIAQTAEAEGYHILTFAGATNHDEWSPYERLMLSNRVDGFVLSNTTENDPRIRYLLDQDFPFVSMGQANPDWDFPFVDIDGKSSGYLATQHLIEYGHRRIALLAWLHDASMVGKLRYQGYMQALTGAGITPDERLIVSGENTPQAGARATAALLQRPPEARPTAIVAISDLLAIGACNALYEAGLQPGKDIAVVGHDDIPTAECFRPPLTSLRQPMHEAGRLIIKMLLQIIRGETPAQRQILLKPALIIRQSSGSPC